MQEFNIDLGLKELYTLKNFTFDIVNTGSADLQIDDITTSGENVQIPYIKTPFYVMQSTTFSIFGYLKILNNGTSMKRDYIDYSVSLINDSTIREYDTYRYLLNYESVLYNNYTQVLSVSNVTYIKNMLIIYFDSDTSIANTPSIILLSIDNVDYYLFPTVLQMSDTKVMYVFQDTLIKNIVVDTAIKLFLSNSNDQELEIKRLSLRSI